MKSLICVSWLAVGSLYEGGDNIVISMTTRRADGEVGILRGETVRSGLRDRMRRENTYYPMELAALISLWLA
jgi:hypothetical protein